MTQTLYLIFISGLCSFTLGSSDFHLVELSKSYDEAKTYCRDMYTDLASIHNSTDMNNLIALVSTTTTARAWIGLEAGDVRMWHWSRPDQKLDFLNWRPGEPQNNDQDACAGMDQRGEWFESDCRTRRSFVCHGKSESSDHIFVAETKSWRDAQNHCRGLSSELVSIRSAEENEAVHNVSMSQDVWMGLFKDPWRWSDGSNTSFRHWKPSQPNYLEGQDCVTVIFNDGRWNDLRCSGKRSFVCRGARKSVSTTTSQTTTQSKVTTTGPSTSSQGVTVTLHLTLTGQTNTTTNGATTASGRTTPNATDIVSSTSSTVQETTDGVSVLTTLTSAQPTESNHSSPAGNLILIQENMTWIEAMSYCREHHIDLVHITNRDIQEKVAEKAKNATSPHVWLGLRYTCSFNFWFWISSAKGYYLNWAPGQGPERTYDCGVTGAIEATGRQQWVALPETDELNFICYACAG